MNETASLQNLNDIVAPAAISWWPLAPGWYVLMAILVIGLAWWAVTGFRRWRSNRYRRQALREFASIRTASPQATVRLPQLLKRTALSAWPRQQVAALSGKEWHLFLDRSAAMTDFTDGAGVLLDRVAYHGDTDLQLEDSERAFLYEAAGAWLKRHRAERTAAP